MNQIVIIAGEYFIFLSLTLAVIVACRLRNRNERVNYIIFLIVSGAFALMLARIGGQLVSDPRPFVVGHFLPLIPHVVDNGFPSDHTLFVALLGWATLRYSKKYGVAMLCLALLIGLARVLAGVHHVEDILGAFAISGMAVFLVQLIRSRIRYKRRV